MSVAVGSDDDVTAAGSGRGGVMEAAEVLVDDGGFVGGVGGGVMASVVCVLEVRMVASVSVDVEDDLMMDRIFDTVRSSGGTQRHGRLIGH